MKKWLLAAALAVAFGTGVVAQSQILSPVSPGPRLIDGSIINELIARVTGTSSGNYTGTFNGSIGGVLPGSGVFSSITTGAIMGTDDTTIEGTSSTRASTATPAAASAVASLCMGSANVCIYWGTGTPNSVITAAKGSLYIQTDGSSSSSRLWISNGTNAWISVTTAS